MAATKFPPSVAVAVSLFVLSRRPGSMVSLADGILVVRQLAPWCEHTDEELAELVAATAIRQRRNVAFDAAEAREHMDGRCPEPAATELTLH